MNNTQERLDALRETIDELGVLHRPSHVEPVLDAIASALKPLHDFPAELNRMAVPLDRLLAYLTRERLFSREAAEAASRLLEAASAEGYDWDRPDGVDESDRDLLFKELNALHDLFEVEFSESDDEDEDS